MLRLPPEGFRFSVNTHNVDLGALVEWIEGSIVFSDDSISQSDVIDVLTEEEIYKSQDFASEYVARAWSELAWRGKILGTYCPFVVKERRVERKTDWSETPAYSFCLFLALQVRYRKELKYNIEPDYGGQGLLFEKLTQASLEVKGLRVHSTAWSKTASFSILDRIQDLANHLGEPATVGASERWAAPQMKDGGLDVVCHWPFPDGWGGRPVYFVQCASGDDWKDKKSTPNISLWNKLIDFSTKPQRGMAMPFALLEDEFRRESNYDLLAMLLDRHRLCVPNISMSNPWPIDPLRSELNDFIRPRVQALPSVD